MKLKPGRCRCGAIVHLVEQAGLSWTADTTPLDVTGAVSALQAGRELYLIRFDGDTAVDLSTAKPAILGALSGSPADRPFVVQSHGCPTGAVKAVDGPLTASQRSGGTGSPKGGVRARTTPSSALLDVTVGSAARRDGSRSTETRRSDDFINRICDRCKVMIGRDWRVVGVKYDNRWMWIRHDYDCKR